MQNENDRENLLTDDSAVVGPVPGDSPRWLNSADATSDLVRQFSAEFIRRYGVVSHKDLMAWLTNECFRMNSLFIGDGLETMPYRRGPWNTPDQLGHHLALAMNIDGELRLSVRDAFMIFASRLGELMRSHQDAASLQHLQKVLDAEVSKFAGMLIGVDGVVL